MTHKASSDREASPSMGGREIGYRPDVDGLRAVAVLSVVVYHFLPSALPGGFLGVDVFFVISGFLITAILVRENQAANWSIWRFYKRRVRRIAPALIVMIAVTTAVAVRIMLPFDLAGYSKSLLATFGFVSNVFFWRDSDYFAAAAQTKPLLHTWSLGIEEQFYILFPPLLWLLLRRGRAFAFGAVALLTLASVALAAATNHFGKPAVSFYLLPMRAWELGVGALLALSPKGPVCASPALGLLGCGLVAFALTTRIWATHTVLPEALPICLGTALLIGSGTGGGFVARALSWRPLVFVGLISFSLYLWHWPVNVFLRYWLIREPATLELIGGIALSFALAYASWRWVEMPFRNRGLRFARLLAWVVPSTAALAAAAIALIALGGLPARFPAQANAYNRLAGTTYRCPPTDYFPFGALYGCPINLPSHDVARASVALFGDSYAQMYAPALEPVLRARGLGGILVPSNGCLPTARINVDKLCAEVMRGNLAALAASPGIRTVIVAAYWGHIHDPLVDRAGKPLGKSPGLAIDAVAETVDTLERAGKRVIVIGPIAAPGYDMASVVGRTLAFGRPMTTPMAVRRSTFDSSYAPLTVWLRTRRELIVEQPSSLFCDASTCRYLVAGKPVFADEVHVAAEAAPMFSSMLASAIDHWRGFPDPVAPTHARPAEPPV